MHVKYQNTKAIEMLYNRVFDQIFVLTSCFAIKHKGSIISNASHNYKKNNHERKYKVFKN